MLNYEAASLNSYQSVVIEFYVPPNSPIAILGLKIIQCENLIVIPVKGSGPISSRVL